MVQQQRITKTNHAAYYESTKNQDTVKCVFWGYNDEESGGSQPTFRSKNIATIYMFKQWAKQETISCYLLHAGFLPD
jgi:hypothetical protein